MNIIIYTLIILTVSYFLIKWLRSVFSKKMSKSVRLFTILILIFLAILFAVGGKILLTLPLTLLGLALVKLKGLSVFQLFSLFRLIQTLRQSGRFSFNQSRNNNPNTLSVSEAYKILNLDINKKPTIYLVNQTYINIQKKIHPYISTETLLLSALLNKPTAKIIKDLY